MSDSTSLITQMRKGAIEYCVLALLRGGERYGYEMVQALSKVDGMLVTEGTIYPLLGRLKRDGLVMTELRESEAGRARRYYRLLPEGEAALAEFIRQWGTFTCAVDTILHQGDAL